MGVVNQASARRPSPYADDYSRSAGPMDIPQPGGGPFPAGRGLDSRKLRYLPIPRTLAEREMQQARQRELAQVLARQGWDPHTLAEAHKDGIDFRSLAESPAVDKPRRGVDPVSGAEYQEFDQPGGRVIRRQILNEKGIALHRPKPDAFSGLTEGGGEWKMDRGEYGQAENYRLVRPDKPEKPAKQIPLARRVLEDGRVVMEHRYQDPEGGVTVKQIQAMNEDGTPQYDTTAKARWRSEDKLIHGEANLTADGRWNEGTAKYSLSDVGKNWARAYASRQSQLENAVNGLRAQLRTEQANLDALKESNAPQLKRGIPLDATSKARMDDATARVAAITRQMDAANQRIEDVKSRRSAFYDKLKEHGVADESPRPDVESGAAPGVSTTPDADLPDFRPGKKKDAAVPAEKPAADAPVKQTNADYGRRLRDWFKTDEGKPWAEHFAGGHISGIDNLHLIVAGRPESFTNDDVRQAAKDAAAPSFGNLMEKGETVTHVRVLRDPNASPDSSNAGNVDIPGPAREATDAGRPLPSSVVPSQPSIPKIDDGGVPLLSSGRPAPDSLGALAFPGSDRIPLGDGAAIVIGARDAGDVSLPPEEDEAPAEVGSPEDFESLPVGRRFSYGGRIGRKTR